jgi:hypothetical protein
VLLAAGALLCLPGCANRTTASSASPPGETAPGARARREVTRAAIEDAFAATDASASAFAPDAAAPATSAAAPVDAVDLDARLAEVHPGEGGLRAFRQILGGSLNYPARRLTWILRRRPPGALLTLFCETSRSGAVSPMRGVPIDGTEDRPVTWDAPRAASFEVDSVEAGGASILVLRGDTEALEPCTKLPSRMRLACGEAPVVVLAAGARLVAPRRARPSKSESAVAWRWEPGGRETVRGDRCVLAKLPSDAGGGWADDRIVSAVPSDWPLVFVAPRGAAPGVEWAYQNDDMVVQQGAFRWMRSAAP